MRSWDDVLRSMVSGSGATVAVRTLDAPLERIKILLQNQNMASAEHNRYAGAIDAARRIAKEQGIVAFMRGNLTNCVRVIPGSALRFTFMDHFQALAAYGLPAPDGAQPAVLPLHRQMLSGAMSGALPTLLVYPLDLTRTKLSADVGVSRQYAGIVDCIRQTTRRHGWRGNYRGLLVSLLEIMPYTALSMGGYEYFKRLVPSDDPLRKFGIGWASGLVGSLVCYPLDTVKRQLMLDGSLGFQSKYSGSISTCMTVLYREEGVRAFYRGGLLNAIKSAPVAGLTFVFNDVFRNLLGFRPST